MKQDLIGVMATEVNAARLLVYWAAVQKDQERLARRLQFAPRRYTRDERRSLRAALRGEALNRLKLLEVERSQVVSVEEKAYKDMSGMDQEGER